MMNTKEVVNEIQGGKVLTSTLMKYSGQIFERRLTGCEKSTERFFILLSSQKKKMRKLSKSGHYFYCHFSNWSTAVVVFSCGFKRRQQYVIDIGTIPIRLRVSKANNAAV